MLMTLSRSYDMLSSSVVALVGIDPTPRGLEPPVLASTPKGNVVTGAGFEPANAGL